MCVLFLPADYINVLKKKSVLFSNDEWNITLRHLGVKLLFSNGVADFFSPPQRFLFVSIVFEMGRG